MKEKTLKSGDNLIVDDCDFELASIYTWYVDRHGYVKRSIHRRNEVGKKTCVKVSIHREIMKPDKGILVDHINGNKLDNRRSNLRLCTPAGNSMNRRKLHKKSSEFKGVSFCNRQKKYLSRIKFQRKSISLGYFKNELDAAIAYNTAALKYHGEFACINQIPAPPVSGGKDREEKI